MAIYHLSVKNIGRSDGRSAVAASAYRSGGAMRDDETGRRFDYSKKRGVKYTEVFLCANAPESYRDRNTLWNEVQKAEKASDARLCREFQIALPREFPAKLARETAAGFARSLTAEGMCVDVAIHDNGDGNPHIHMLATTRAIKGDGTWAAKERKAYALDGEGNRKPILDKNGVQKKGARNSLLWERETIQANDWNNREKISEWRERWAGMCNRHLEPHSRIDHRSHADRGIGEPPTVHEGHAARRIEARGGVSELCQLNRDIREYNALLRETRELRREMAEEERLEKERREAGMAEKTRPEKGMKIKLERLVPPISMQAGDAAVETATQLHPVRMELIKDPTPDGAGGPLTVEGVIRGDKAAPVRVHVAGDAARRFAKEYRKGDTVAFLGEPMAISGELGYRMEGVLHGGADAGPNHVNVGGVLKGKPEDRTDAARPDEPVLRCIVEIETSTGPVKAHVSAKGEEMCERLRRHGDGDFVNLICTHELLFKSRDEKLIILDIKGMPGGGEEGFHAVQNEIKGLLNAPGRDTVPGILKRSYGEPERRAERNDGPGKTKKFKLEF